LILIYLIFNY